jgi:type I restriction enzyme S subunit
LNLESIEIPFLSIKKQEESVNRIKSIFDVSNNLVATQTQKLNHLKALKSSLLDQAFKGKF